MGEDSGGLGFDVEVIATEVKAGTDKIVVPKELVEEQDPQAPQRLEVNSLYAQIMRMGVSEKVKLALRGNKDARSILIRDPLKQIRRFVMQNPRITDGEVVAVARNRSADDELLRLIADKKEWIGNYQVKAAIVSNPKTPLPIAIRHLTSLGERDLRALAKSRNVSAAVATQARRLLAAKNPGGA